jgi:hypothetical protein
VRVGKEAVRVGKEAVRVGKEAVRVGKTVNIGADCLGRLSGSRRTS